MNILMLVDWTYPCDHQFLTQVYSKNFIERGHSITWVMRPNSNNQNSIHYKKWNGSDVFILPSESFNPIRTTAKHLTKSINTHAIFDTGLDFTQFDLIHVRNDLCMGLVAANISEKINIPYVHQISHLKSETIMEESQNGYNTRRTWIKGYLGAKLRQYISNSANIILPISNEMENFLQEKGSNSKMEVLTTGTQTIDNIPDPNKFKEEYNIDGGHSLLYMGSMSPSRRLNFLFEVMEEINNVSDTTLIMAGGREKSDRERLKKIANEKGILDRITFTGWISDRNMMGSAIVAADLGLSPFPTDSILRTNAPIKTLEYMSLGTPVVASNTPDQEHVLKNSGGGIAVDYSPESFSRAINYLLSSQELRIRMGAQARIYISNNRNFHSLTNRVESIYKEMISGNKSK